MDNNDKTEKTEFTEFSEKFGKLNLKNQTCENFTQALKIVGGKKLFGQVEVDASKNAFLPILAACVLCDGQVVLQNYVNLTDLESMRAILGELGVVCSLSGRELFVDARTSLPSTISHELSQKLRASIILLGACLGRFRTATIAHPGGCKIGARPFDIHISALRQLGAKISQRHGYIYANGEFLHSGEVVFPFPSVGATESLMMCATLLDGQTTLKNVAKEPEIVDLQNFLNLAGAKISGAGSDQIRIEGVKILHGANFRVMSDRIVAGSYMLAAAAVGGQVTLLGADASQNESLVAFLRQSACQIDVKGDKIKVTSSGNPISIEKIETMPYPYFPTDLQPQMMVLQAVSKGVCMIHENMFENRFGVVEELRKMGANITVQDRVACVIGVEKLFGADVFASDLRAGGALVIAGLAAQGYTTLHNLHYIDRGYEKIEEKFASLGGQIERIKT